MSLFKLNGKPIYRGDKVHVSPDFWNAAGPIVTVEKYYNDASVLTRSDNGAVPILPVSALSLTPHPETVVLEEMCRAGVKNPSRRDVSIWLLARKTR